jgi:hypothetical protein
MKNSVFLKQWMKFPVTRNLKITKVAPNVSVKWFSLVFRIEEFLGSNLGPEIGYPD